MIARTWHGMTPASKSDEYLDYLNKTGIPEYRATPGNQGVYVFRRIEGGKAHFLLLTSGNPKKPLNGLQAQI